MVDAIEQLRAQGVTSSGVVHRAHYSRVADRIASEAEAMAADAIILGSPRNRFLISLFSHGVAERTARLTPLPILLAPAPLRVPPMADFDLTDIARVQREREQTLSD